MAQAGVTWRSGRESRDEYSESLAPLQADNQLQAYNFRFIMTTEPSNRITPAAPADTAVKILSECSRHSSLADQSHLRLPIQVHL